MAYQPIHAGGPAAHGVEFDLDGWQQLLDLLEERTGESYDDLWIDWVVSDDQQRQLADAPSARACLRRHRGGGGGLGAAGAIRATRWDRGSSTMRARRTSTMRTTSYGTATEIDGRGGDLELTPPATLQAAFEGDGGLSAAADEADAEADALAALASRAPTSWTANRACSRRSDCSGTDPDSELTDARDAFESGDLEQAGEAADARGRSAGWSGRRRSRAGRWSPAAPSCCWTRCSWACCSGRQAAPAQTARPPALLVNRSISAVLLGTFTLRFSTGLTGGLLVYYLADLPRLRRRAGGQHHGRHPDRGLLRSPSWSSPRPSGTSPTASARIGSCRSGPIFGVVAVLITAVTATSGSSAARACWRAPRRRPPSRRSWATSRSPPPATSPSAGARCRASRRPRWLGIGFGIVAAGPIFDAVGRVGFLLNAGIYVGSFAIYRWGVAELHHDAGDG